MKQALAYICIFSFFLGIPALLIWSGYDAIKKEESKPKDIIPQSVSSTDLKENFKCIYKDTFKVEDSITITYQEAIFVDDTTKTLYGYLGKFANSSVPGGLFELVTPSGEPFTYDSENIPKLEVLSQSCEKGLDICTFVDTTYKVRYVMVANGFSSAGVTVIRNKDGSVSTY